MACTALLPHSLAPDACFPRRGGPAATQSPPRPHAGLHITPRICNLFCFFVSSCCLPALPSQLIACCSRLPTSSPQVKVPGSNEYEPSTLLTRNTYSLDQASGFAL